MTLATSNICHFNVCTFSIHFWVIHNHFVFKWPKKSHCWLNLGLVGGNCIALDDSANHLFLLHQPSGEKSWRCCSSKYCEERKLWRAAPTIIFPEIERILGKKGQKKLIAFLSFRRPPTNRPLKTTITLLPSCGLQNFEHQSHHSGHGIMCKRQGKTMLGSKSKWIPLRLLGLQEHLRRTKF